MTFGEAIASGFRNYVGFEGRASRSEYWFWVLFVILVSLATGILDYIIFLIGGLMLLVFFVMRGTPGPNRFGPDPLAGAMPAGPAY